MYCSMSYLEVPLDNFKKASKKPSKDKEYSKDKSKKKDYSKDRERKRGLQD